MWQYGPSSGSNGGYLTMKRIKWVGVLAGVAVLVLGVSIYLSRDGSDRHQKSESPVSEGTPAAAAETAEVPTPSDAPEAGQTPEKRPAASVTFPDSSVDDMPLPRTTATDLLNRGMPLMTAPRKLVYDRTAAQSTEEVVRDLGEIATVALCMPTHDDLSFLNRISRWSWRVPHNIRVLRLIEEGRKDPGLVEQLLVEQLRSEIERFGELREAYKVAWRESATRKKPVGGRYGDPYYEEHKRYEHAIPESERVYFVVYASFYILASLDRHHPELLADWVREEKWLFAVSTPHR